MSAMTVDTKCVTAVRVGTWGMGFPSGPPSDTCTLAHTVTRRVGIATLAGSIAGRMEFALNVARTRDITLSAHCAVSAGLESTTAFV